MHFCCSCHAHILSQVNKAVRCLGIRLHSPVQHELSVSVAVLWLQVCQGVQPTAQDPVPREQHAVEWCVAHARQPVGCGSRHLQHQPQRRQHLLPAQQPREGPHERHRQRNRLPNDVQVCSAAAWPQLSPRPSPFGGDIAECSFSQLTLRLAGGGPAEPQQSWQQRQCRRVVLDWPCMCPSASDTMG